jgi:hypothetical protein
MSEVDVVVPQAPVHQDRTAVLIFFGVVQLLFGAVCLLFTLAISAVGSFNTARAATARPPQLLSAILVYCGLAIYFFFAGTGSIQRRRWAQPLTLAVSSLWLAVGIVAVTISGYILPKIFSIQQMPHESGILGVVFAVLFTLYVLIPGVFVLVYRSPHVRATCMANDPRPRWTDGVPVPRLALAILFAFGAISLLANLSYPAIPVFGVMLSGAVATAVLLSMSVLCAFMAVQIYRGRPAGWWLMILLQLIGLVTSIVTLMRMDFATMYAQMGIPAEPQTSRIFEVMKDPVLWVMAGVFWLALLAYMIWCRRYFGVAPRRDDITSSPASSA